MGQTYIMFSILGALLLIASSMRQEIGLEKLQKERHRWSIFFAFLLIICGASFVPAGLTDHPTITFFGGGAPLVVVLIILVVAWVISEFDIRRKSLPLDDFIELLYGARLKVVHAYLEKNLKKPIELERLYEESQTWSPKFGAAMTAEAIDRVSDIAGATMLRRLLLAIENTRDTFAPALQNYFEKNNMQVSLLDGAGKDLSPDILESWPHQLCFVRLNQIAVPRRTWSERLLMIRKPKFKALPWGSKPT